MYVVESVHYLESSSKSLSLIYMGILMDVLLAVIFASIEQPYELQHRNFHMREIRKAEEAIFDYDATSDPHNQTALLLIDHLTLVTFMAFEAGVKPCEVRCSVEESFVAFIGPKVVVLTKCGLHRQARPCDSQDKSQSTPIDTNTYKGSINKRCAMPEQSNNE
uniref:G_PROTEIN_RECEP_F1_2 domain-containing protein n=1 Tax=Heterorhabditis bacteriophora TaxID=37862 RepID=A0A1I7WXS4_HETBA